MIRILSDLHYRHPAGFVQRLEQIAPLLEGAERIIFNGDSVEARFLAERESGAQDAEALKAFCAGAGVHATLITGNHDPLINDCHHVDLPEHGVVATHGDILFRGLTPWSRETPLLIAAHDRALAEAGHPDMLEPLLIAARKAALAVERLGPLPHHQAQVRTVSGFFRQIWPPGRVIRMLEAWWRVPELAARFAGEHRPDAQCVLIGHTHRAGVWRRRGRLVVNTGAFLPWAGLLMVDIDERGIQVREIEERQGIFHPGRCVARG